MKKIFLTTLLALGMVTFIACSKKGKSSNNSSYNCSMYPGTVTVTNPQQIQLFMYQIGQGVRPPPGNYYGGGNQNYNGYGTAYICVDQYVYSQYAGGGNGGGNGNYSYCLQHPYDYQCQQGTYPPGNGGSCVTVCDSTGWCYCY